MLGWMVSKHISIANVLKTGHSIVRQGCQSHVEISYIKKGHKGTEILVNMRVRITSLEE
jgi:hypothetical protein